VRVREGETMRVRESAREAKTSLTYSAFSRPTVPALCK
jgi:hypothetical protein